MSIREKALGPDHRDVGSTLNNLAVLYNNQGRFANTEPLYKRALSIREKALGPTTRMSVSRLTTSLRSITARAVLPTPSRSQARFVKLQKALGLDHPNVGTVLNNLAALYNSQGRFADAEPLYKRALSSYKKALGLDHPKVGTALSNLAEFYRGQGRFADAEPLFKRALSIREKALGPDHRGCRRHA